MVSTSLKEKVYDRLGRLETIPAMSAIRRGIIRWSKRRYLASASSFPRRIVRHDYDGITLNVVISDPEAADWYDRDWPEANEMRLLRRGKLRNGAVVYNIGAHKGIVACMLSAYVGAGGFVVAVDPHPGNCEVFRENIRLNNISNVAIAPAAAGETPGKAFINYKSNTRLTDVGGKMDSEYEVDMTTVDTLSGIFRPPDVLFVDVEGYEQKVLLGAANSMQSLPDCYVEIHTGCGLEQAGDTVMDVLSHFPSELYKLYVVDDIDGTISELKELTHLPRRRFGLVALAKQ